MRRPNELECVVLERDLPEFRLHSGDIGVVVLVYERDAVEVEFLDRDGETVAVLTILDQDLRIATPHEISENKGIDPLPPGDDVAVADATGENKARRI